MHPTHREYDNMQGFHLQWYGSYPLFPTHLPDERCFPRITYYMGRMYVGASVGDGEPLILLICHRRMWTTHPVHISLVIGEVEPLTLCSHISSRGIIGKCEQSPCTQRTYRGRWTTPPLVIHSFMKYPGPLGACRSHCTTQPGPSWEGPSKTPNLSPKANKLTFPKGYMRMSTIFSSVLMCWILITPYCTISRIRWYLI